MYEVKEQWEYYFIDWLSNNDPNCDHANRVEMEKAINEASPFLSLELLSESEMKQIWQSAVMKVAYP